MENNLEVRKDLNEMVKGLNFGIVKSSYGTRYPLRLKLDDGTPSGKVLEFRDSDDVHGALQSYVTLGEKDFIKSKALVEELSIDEEGNVSGKYICIKYELTDGNIFRFFPSRSQLIIIENLYKFWKNNHKSSAKQG